MPAVFMVGSAGVAVLALCIEEAVGFEELNRLAMAPRAWEDAIFDSADRRWID